ncbi:hypothetical protein OV079_23670 [Nannocystis pusilla]|uniref:Uncharacterized protein n=1 Tax=Nannocystis pusilla TaxID=889268 RepID=A0A9X3IYH8_9BACT|nr:hypothetical protein [Nannocystis pusilla]MCY1008501.1 hypothetical protein [Nannocystis pusilla]
MRTDTTDTTMPTATTTKPARNRRTPPRLEQLSHADSANATSTPAAATAATAATEQPTPSPAAPELTPAVAERLAKEKAKLEREEKAAARRRQRIEALERGETPPTATKGLPPVVKMNELGALTRQLHRALRLAESSEVKALAATAELGGCDVRAIAYFRAARNEAIALWKRQHEARAAAGAVDNDTLHPLGLEEDATGDYRLTEKPRVSE